MKTIHGMMFEDSREELESYTIYLQRYGIFLKLCSTIEEAIAALRDDDSKTWSLVVIDSVVAHGGVYSDAETGDARYTGLCLIRDIREGKHGFKVDPNIPILILTNVPHDNVMDTFIKKHEKTSRIKYRRKMPLIKDLIVDIKSLTDERE